MANGKLRGLAKYITENALYDKETNSLFVTNTGISFEVLKALSKKHNFTLGQTKTGEYVSIPLSYKYTDKAQDISLYDDFMNTYTYYNRNYDTLLTAYKTFDLMEENLSEVSLMLDTYTAEVLNQGFVDTPIRIKISNSAAQSLIERVFYKNDVYKRIPSIVRSIAKYGNYGVVLSYPYLEDKLSSEDLNLSKIDVLEDLHISYVNPKYFKVNVDEYYNPINYETQLDNTYVSITQNSSFNKKIWQPWQFVHFLIPSEITEPYGKSMLWSMRSSFDQLTTLEALLGISRASKIQRLVFYVPMPNGVSAMDSFGYLQDFKANYLNSAFTDQGSLKNGRKIPGAMSILTLPVSHDGKKVEVDHIESNIDLSSIEDVEYFLDKILRNSSLPKGYLIGEDVITTAQALEAQDLKLKRTLIPLKQALLTGLMNLVENVLTHAGYDVSNLKIDIELNEPIQVPADVIQKYSDINELLKSCLELNSSMPVINQFQFLVKMGVPSDVAGLICSNVPIVSPGMPEELANFLLGQKTKSGQLSTASVPELEEAVEMKLSSKDFLKTNVNLHKMLKEVSKIIRSTDMDLKESCLKSENVIIESSSEKNE